MKTGTRDSTKCRRCKDPFSTHEDGACPDGKGKWLGHKRRVAASQSYNEGEVTLLNALCVGLMNGGDVRHIARSEHFASVARKAMSMRKAIDKAKGALVNRNCKDCGGDITFRNEYSGRCFTCEEKHVGQGNAHVTRPA